VPDLLQPENSFNVLDKAMGSSLERHNQCLLFGTSTSSGCEACVRRGQLTGLAGWQRGAGRARRFGSDALNYAVGLAQGYKSCEREALAQMMDLLAKCAAARMRIASVTCSSKPDRILSTPLLTTA